MNNRRRMMVSKDIPITNGVYIEATNGKLFTANKWTGNLTPNSVVVIHNSVSFRIALTQSSDLMKIHSSYAGALERYMTAFSDAPSAKLDMQSAENTASIMKVQSGTGYAAGYCNSFTFPDGKTKGVLPALGWLWTAYNNKAAVDACLAACGATAMDTTEPHWSSTFWGVNIIYRRCWVLKWSDGSLSYGNLSNIARVRPFAEYN